MCKILLFSKLFDRYLSKCLPDDCFCQNDMSCFILKMNFKYSFNITLGLKRMFIEVDFILD